MAKETNKKILIVEDDEDFLFILEKAFKSSGFDVSTAKDGEAGFNAALKNKPDIILSDVLLPRADGPTMAQRLKDQNVKTPVIFLTNVTMENRGGNMEKVEYLMKSKLHLDEIVEEIKKKLS